MMHRSAHLVLEDGTVFAGGNAAFGPEGEELPISAEGIVEVRA